MDPTPNAAPTPAPPAAPTGFDPVVDLIRSQRQNVGFALTAVAIAFLVAAVALAVQYQRLGATTTTTATDKDKDKDADNPFKMTPTDSSELTQPNRFDYVVGAFGCVLGLIVTGSGAAYLIVGLPKPTEAGQRREARAFLLALGGLLGAFLILVGIWFFYRWSDSLVKWLDKGELKEARWVLIPLLMVVVGGAIMFLAIQPARAEERNNTTIRRLVYGSNFGLTILILFVVLVIANAVIAMRLPNKLDTTSNAFYTLSPQTKQLIEGLDQPIHAYAIFQGQEGDLITGDMKKLLLSCQETNPSKFQVTFYSPALNKADITKLKAEYPMAEMSQEGVLLVAGEESGERKRHSFLRADEFEETATAGGQQVPAFNGEPKLLRELMFLAENKKKPKVYFTQSSGEMALGAGARGGDARRSIAQLKGYLEKNYFDVAELNFPVGAEAKVPDDATVVVVADPTSPLPQNGVEAISRFMTEPRADGSKGKLVALAGQQPGPDRRPLKLGLEPLLGTFGVQLSDRFMYNEPIEQLPNPGLAVAGVQKEAVSANNSVAVAFAGQQFILGDCREVRTTQGGGAFRAVTVLATLRGRMTWTQAEYAPPRQAYQNLVERTRAIRNAKNEQERRQLIMTLNTDFQVSPDSRPLAVFVTERDRDKDVARVAVFGCGEFVSDEAGQANRGQGTTLAQDLMGSTLDWARDRPTPAGLTPKPYTAYTLKPGYDSLRLTLVPLALSLLLVLGVGAGVWVIRRK